MYVFDNPPYVYFLQIGDSGPIKIGYSKDPIKRLRQAQVYNPSLVKLISVEHGTMRHEKDLHIKFKKFHIYGEWFLPDQELLDYVYKLELVNIYSQDFRLTPPRGDRCSNWKGDAASPASKRQRTKRRFKLKPQCEKCGKVAYDLIHYDGNLNNISENNIKSMCRRCRMVLDGTLNTFLNAAKNKVIKAMSDCIVCCKKEKDLRKRRCHACNEYFRRHKFDKHEFNQETDDVILLKNMKNIKMNEEKAKLLIKLYSSKKFSAQFLAGQAGISSSYFTHTINNKHYKE